MQMSIPFDLPHNGTATSMAAAKSMKPHARAIRERILSFIARQRYGATCDEVEIALGLSHQCCSARITELHAPRPGKGVAKIKESGERKTRSGRPAVVWVSA